MALLGLSHALAMVCFAAWPSAHATKACQAYEFAVGACTSEQADSEGFTALQLPSGKLAVHRDGVDGPPGGAVEPRPRVAYGGMLTQQEWESKYDFVVKLSKNGKAECTGIVWGNKVLTAAHCGFEDDGSFVGPEAWSAQTASDSSPVSAVVVHPKYDNKKKSSDYDFMIVTLQKAMHNRQAMSLKSTVNPLGTHLMIAGIGDTAPGDGNPTDVPRPVASDYMSTSSCGWHGPNVECIGSGSASRQSSCGGDSGGPWFHWISSPNEPKNEPNPRYGGKKVNEAWDALNEDEQSCYVKGTAWFSYLRGPNGKTRQLAASPVDCQQQCANFPGCAHWSFSHDNCYFAAAGAKEKWNRRAISGPAICPTLSPVAVVVAGVNSFGWNGACGDPNKMTGFGPTAVAHEWIEQVAQGHFPWTP